MACLISVPTHVMVVRGSFWVDRSLGAMRQIGYCCPFFLECGFDQA